MLTHNTFRFLATTLALLAALLISAPQNASAGPYTLSAHGDTLTGVARTALLTAGTAGAGFAQGNCVHCHEQHASVGSSEPAPVGGPIKFTLFAGDNYGQATNFCFNCHVGSGGYQDTASVRNRSYSFRAGGWLADTLDNVKTAFGQASSHNLQDIVNFVATPPLNWANQKYTSSSNACAVCHDPHVVQGDPPSNTTVGKTAATRGVVITEVDSITATAPFINLWGDIAGEKMTAYTATNYRAPYCFGSTNSEPECNTNITTNGSDMPNFVTFCSKCHDKDNFAGTDVTSNALGILTKIDWTLTGTDKHGQVLADAEIRMLTSGVSGSPYASGGGGLGYVLSCTDCHEPHGSLSQSLLRGEVNGGLTGVIAGGSFGPFCATCHDPFPGGGTQNWEYVHHPGGTSTDAPYAPGVPPNCNTPGPGVSCHTDTNGTVPIVCSNCHYHRAATVSSPPGTVLDPTLGAAARTLF